MSFRTSSHACCTLLVARRNAIKARTQAGNQLGALLVTAPPAERETLGRGPLTTATLLLTAGDNSERLRSDAALAAPCGVSPLEASSGLTTRHRLNRGGDRQANNALWTIALIRMRSDPRTRTYVEHRQAEGRSRKEILRCLKRYLARELYPLILADLAAFRAPRLT